MTSNTAHGEQGKRVALVSGATSGIGLETARGLAAAGWNLVLACRDLPRAEAVAATVRAAHPAVTVSCVALDLASLASVRACGATLAREQPRLDLLVNNAGVFCDTRQVTVDGFEATIGVNFLGTMLLTRLLVPMLRATATQTGHARIVFVSSAAAAYGKLRTGDGCFTDGPHGFPGYAASKLAQVHFAKALAEELAGTGVTVNAVHPGDAATNIWRGQSLLMRLVAPVMRRWLRAPAVAASAVLHAALAPELEGVTGAFFGVKGERLHARRYDDVAVRSALLARASAAIGVE